jgi:uncharacterized membrane protein (UPF0127 family)
MIDTPAQPSMRRSPLLSLALLFLATSGFSCLGNGAELTASNIEPLSQFPQGHIQIQDHQNAYDFTVWLASTYERREQGLMFVKHLEPSRGMLFTFETAQPEAFWMKNTFIPLDILYVNQQGTVIHIAESAAPFSLEPIPSMGPVKWVVELAGGTCQRLKISTGAHLDIKP